MKQIKPADITVPEVHRLLLGGVGPRPIALVSSISGTGLRNLSPFSFFNAFGANPPLIIFSPARRGRDATLKDTYLNVAETKECVVHAVTHDMVEQINLASTEYPPDVDEFLTSGFTPVPSVLVRPERVKESPFQMECKVLEVRSFGNGGGSANLVICEVVLFHVAEDIFINGIIHPDKIDLVARMGGDFYTRAVSPSVFEIEKPLTKIGIGYNHLPEYIRKSPFLSGNDIAKLANHTAIPSPDEVSGFIAQHEKDTVISYELTPQSFKRCLRMEEESHAISHSLASASGKLPYSISDYFATVKLLLEKNRTSRAWCLLVYLKMQGKI